MRMHVRLALSVAAALVFSAVAVPASAAPWSAGVMTAIGNADAHSDVHRIGRWDRHPRRHMRYSLPPDIFKPRCWISRWGDIHCPYARRRLRHWQHRRCTVDPRGRLVCPY